MFGVVLWSDTEENKAVIWCEDHGDLAFYRQNEGEGSLALDAGDLVRFDITMDQQFRYAHNPRLVSGSYHPQLADALVSSVDEGRASADDVAASEFSGQRMPQPERLSAQIIPFRPDARRPAKAGEHAAMIRG